MSAINCVVDTKAVILSFRHDLRRTGMSLHGARQAAYFGWLVAHGLKLYPTLAGDPELIAFLSREVSATKHGLTRLQRTIYQARPDVQATFPLKTALPQYLWWFYTFGLDEHHYWSFLTEAEKKFVYSLPEPWVSRLRQLSDVDSRSKAVPIAFENQSFGVNVIGYAYGQLGIGEDARMAARSCLASKVPFNMVSFAPGAEIGQNDRSMQQYVVERGEFAINLFCLTAEETGRYYAEQGPSQFTNRYNIGYWPWELGAWPDAWQMLFDLVDEVWVSSQHTFDALVPVCDKPLYLMPMAVDLGPVKQFKSQRQARAHFGLPVKAKLFCFSFDLNSYIERKNPQACVEAFLLAFAQDEYSDAAVGLVIKVHAPKQPNAAWDRLKALAASDSRVHIIEQTLDRPDLLALYQTCDCFVSLHRAEGFGRGLAEALQLGLRVICTGYSGNLDFCHAPMAELVDYRLVKVGPTQYPHAKGQYWAEPSIQHAAELMQKVFALPEAMPKLRQKPTQKQTQQPEGIAEFSPLVVGKHYKQRLKEIYTKRSEVKLAFYSNF
jgi:glycosyltransferase involved in cell wall biosynthesis